KTQYSSLINKIASGESEFSKAEQQTLAVIAYKKPIRQSIIIKIRGNKAYDHVKKFLELGLLTSKKEGRTYILDLSENFYNYFSISEGKFKELKDISKENGE
ncbi:MAG: SMC-Scp complex subunit ScpB, partial [Nanoarchaeota archaeon]|nr:SMC-Scp complex subunit ScpB [Nanoarchaeota archaeon]